MKKTLDANKLKLIAIFAMTVDHIAWLLFPGYAKGALPVVMHIIGRLTCPIMCYFIAEGYYHTRNIRKYTFRLFLFAVISHFAYSFASNDFVDARSLIPFYFGGILNQTSVMWPLAWGLVMLRVANSERFTQLQKTLLVVLICLVSFPSDWSCIASLCVLAFGTNRGDLKAQGRWMLFFVALYAVVGIGINCARVDLPPEVSAMSASLEAFTGQKPDRARLAAALVRSLCELEQALFTEKDAWLREFAAHCITIGQDVKLVRGDDVTYAHADGIDEEAALLVTYPDGTKAAVASGEVSVRGMYGYA